jgi:hypothetical protein
MAAEDRDQLVAYNLDDLFGRGKGGEDLTAEGLLLNTVQQLADNFEVNVGFEQGQADLTQGVLEISFGELPLAAEVLKNPLEFFGETIEHGHSKGDGFRGLVRHPPPEAVPEIIAKGWRRPLSSVARRRR